jgi:hypothetical protein
MAGIQFETSDLLRLKAGHVDTSNIMADSTALINNFTLQSDQPYYKWVGFIDGGMRNGSVIQSLGGRGALYGKLSGTITFNMLTPDMLDYLFTNIMLGNYISAVTIRAFHPRYKQVTIQCYLSWFENPVEQGTQQTNTWTTNITMTWNRGIIIGNAYSSGYSGGYD